MIRRTTNNVLVNRRSSSHVKTMKSYLLAEDGTYILDETGQRIILEESGNVITGVKHNKLDFRKAAIVNRFTTWFVPTNTLYGSGSKTITTGYEYLLAEDNTYILDENNDRILLEGSGVAEAIASSTSAMWVDVYPNPANSAVVWVNGIGVQAVVSFPLYPDSRPVRIEVTNLNEVYILGTQGDGVTYIYAYLSGEALQFGGVDLQFGGVDITFNP